jgi:hypothetical protein
MRYLEIYNSKKTYYSPAYEEFTPEHVMSHYAIVNIGTCIIETNVSGKMFYSVELIENMRDRLGIDESLTDEEAVKAMETIINTVVEPEPTAEERIASALEFQNLTSLSDVTTD